MMPDPCGCAQSQQVQRLGLEEVESARVIGVNRVAAVDNNLRAFQRLLKPVSGVKVHAGPTRRRDDIVAGQSELLGDLRTDDTSTSGYNDSHFFSCSLGYFVDAILDRHPYERGVDGAAYSQLMLIPGK
ncbi:hypothetical protein GCM10009820_17080 [Leifsonia soli]